MIISILGNGAPFKWTSGLEADRVFKSNSFKIYRKSNVRNSVALSRSFLGLTDLMQQVVESRKASKALLLENASTKSVGITPQTLGRIKHEVLGVSVLSPFPNDILKLNRRVMFGPHVKQIKD